MKGESLKNSEQHSTAPGTGSRDDWFSWFLVAACVLLAVLVLLLAWQNRRLKAERLAARAAALPALALRRGDRFPNMRLTAGGGESLTLPDGDPRRTIVVVYSPDCPACRETLPVWSSLLGSAPPSIRTIGIRVGSGSEDVPFLPFSVYTVEDGARGLQTRVPYTPATLVLDPGGTVVEAWYGVLEEHQRAKLQELVEAG